MNIVEKQNFIRTKAFENSSTAQGEKVYWSQHAIVALLDDKLNRIDIEIALQQSGVIEDYPTSHRPLPDCLVLGIMPNAEPIHAVIAIDRVNDRIFIVTVYRPSIERWQDDWRTRKL